MTTASHDSQARACWCGNTELDVFSEQYRLCRNCATLVSSYGHAGDVSHVGNEEQDLYGREYWFSHMEKDLGLGNLYQRARSDLAERCLYWLKTVLKYAVPSERVLELGSAHGGFVAMLRWAGFEATGLELSSAIASLARELFGVPMLQGPIEDQDIESGSLDVIVLMDVLEHLPDPAQTMRECVRLLKPKGFLLIQTPKYPEGKALADLETEGHRFVEVLKDQEHLYLFSERSVRQLFAELGCAHVVFEPALFGHYDMFLTVSRTPLTAIAPLQQELNLTRTPTGRLVQAALDLFARLQDSDTQFRHADSDREQRLAVIERLREELSEAEMDRRARLEMIEVLHRRLNEAEVDRANRLTTLQELGARLGASEADRHARLLAVDQLETQLAASEADRHARLLAIDQLKKQLAESEADRRARLLAVEQLGKQLAVSDADRHARLLAVEQLTALLKESEADRAARLEVINALHARLKEAEARASA